MREVVIVEALRSPNGRAVKGSFKDTRPDDLLAKVMKALLEKTQLEAKKLDDVIIGCAIPEMEQGMNVARLASLLAGIPYTVPAMTINRFCSSGLQAIAIAAERIMAGQADIILAGGVESMSLVPMEGRKHMHTPNLRLVETYPEAYTPMGITAENVAREFKVSREDQDKFAYQSHMKAAKAQEEGLFEEIVPIETTVITAQNGHVEKKEITLDHDELVRKNTSLEKLATLPPAFMPGGMVTAGNSSPLTDGAAAVLLMAKDVAEALGYTPLVYYRGFQVAGVRPEIMGIGPVEAIPKALKKTGITLDDIEVIELNEAFASQSVACIRELNLDEERVNPLGGAIALGHPLGCTGAYLTAKLIPQLRRRKGRPFGMVTMCIGGGQGAAGIFEVAS
ncbi:MAG: thiolase family protein [Planctomycetota bacterium]|nr:MAG: thiolase family protein [Planctomycetota bacterium]